MTKDTKIRDLRDDLQRRAALTAQMTRDLLACPDELAALAHRHASTTVAEMTAEAVQTALRGDVPRSSVFPIPTPPRTVRDVAPRPRAPRAAVR